MFTHITSNRRFASQFMKPEGFFGKIVSKFMRENNLFVYQGIEEFADFREGEKILEIGYGPGTGLKYLLEKYPIRADGIDFSKLMFKEASKNNSQFIKQGRLTLCCRDFETDYLENDSSAIIKSDKNYYDKIIFANVIYFWKELPPVFFKIKQILRPGGKLVFYMSNRKLLEKSKVAEDSVFIKYSDDFVRKILEETGFINIVIHSILNSKNEFLIISAEKKS